VIGRFTTIDPIPDEEDQESWTPYHYTFNNPIKYTDPDGKNPILGAIFGAATDYGLQVTENLIDGNDLGDALTDVDGASIAVSAVTGAVGGGIVSKLSKIAKLTDKVSDGVKVVKRVESVKKVEKAAEGAQKLSKVEKSVKVEKVGNKFTKTTEVRPGKGAGQSRAEYTRVKNANGKTIKTHKDSYDKANKFQHRKPLRGGPEGRSQ
jgi:hypothetical protein